MKNIQIILNAVLSKNIFEYLLMNKDFEIESYSEGLKMYLKPLPPIGVNIMDYLPELIGSEEEISKILEDRNLKYLLESVYKNDYYLNISIEHYDSNTFLILLHNITDVTLSKQKLLQYSNETTLINSTLQKILDKQNTLLFVVNNEEISYTNAQFMSYFDIKEMRDIRRKNLSIYQYLDSTLVNYNALFNRLLHREEYIVIGKDTFIIQASIIEKTHQLFTLTKITKLSNELQIDGLTGVYKKSYFNTQLERMLRDNEAFVLVVIDIDNFKVVNDTYGHQTGDSVLIEFSKLIQENIREYDLLARWGGEEFLLLFRHSNIENARKKVERIRQLIDENNFTEVGNVTASFGISLREENDDVQTLVKRADIALYDAKHSGKNRVVYKEL